MNDLSELTRTKYYLGSWPGRTITYQEIIEYTGKWKIRIENGVVSLYLQCFLIYDGSRRITPLGWIHESELEVREIKEFINTCGESNG